MRTKAEQCRDCGYKTTDHDKMIRHKDKYCRYRERESEKQKSLDAYGVIKHEKY